MFKQLSGNPFSIRVLAAHHANTMVRNNDLKAIYKTIQNETSLLADDDNSLRSNIGNEGQIGNAISLRLSTEASI